MLMMQCDYADMKGNGNKQNEITVTGSRQQSCVDGCQTGHAASIYCTERMQ